MALQLGLEGKVAIVTGGSAGIGLACAKALFREGAKVAIAARNPEKLASAKKQIVSEAGAEREIDVLTVTADLTKPEDVKKLVQLTTNTFQRIDILVNNAGSASGGSFLQLDDKQFLDAWELKLLGAIRMIREVVPFMIERKEGKIVNIIGGAAKTPRPTFLPGGTTNAALLNFTKGLSKELAKSNVRINAISPGTTATERAVQLIQQESAARGVSISEVEKERISVIPLGRMVQPTEIATMMLLMVSDVIPSLTGAEVIIDGGQTPSL